MSDQKEQRRKDGKGYNWWSCCGTEGWDACCSTDAESGGRVGWRGRGMPGFMGNCFSMCRSFSLIPVIMGLCSLALGYFLSPEALRVLWMVGAGMVVVMGLFGLLIMGRMAAGIRSARR